MSNTSSARKECRKAARRKIVNVNTKSRVKTFVKKLLTLITENKKQEAVKLFPNVQSEVMKAVSKGILKFNTGSRKISLLSKKIQALQE